jgi:hypothetical protein
MTRRAQIGLSALPALALVWSFAGIFVEREWGGLHLFVKHRPSLKVIFYSPLGEADRSFVPGKEGYLSPEDESEESAYREFVEEHDGYDRSITIY